jgi:hypothetical protein
MYKKQMLSIGSFVILVIALTPHFLSCLGEKTTIVPCIAGANSDEIIKKIEKSSELKNKNFWDRLTEEGEDIPEYKDENIYCLGGKQYTFLGRLGSGTEGEVYKIKDMNGNEFALKVYHQPEAKGLKGELLAMTKAKKSRELINVPIEVNMINKERRYSISPFLEKSVSKNDINKLIEFDKKVNTALAEDGLALGDNLNVGNYRYDKNHRLWRIDIGDIKELSH